MVREFSRFAADGQCGVDRFAACGFELPPAVAPAPALGWRGLALATALLAGAGVVRLTRRRRTR
jgi:hypothetical protein